MHADLWIVMGTLAFITAYTEKLRTPKVILFLLSFVAVVEGVVELVQQ